MSYLRFGFFTLLVSLSTIPSLGQPATRDKVASVAWPRLADALNSKVTLSTDTLAELATELSKQTDVPVLVDWRAFEEIGWDAKKQPFPITIETGTLGQALGRVCLYRDFAYTINDHFIRLTTMEAAEQQTVQRLYRVGPLVNYSRDPTHNDPAYMDHQSLIDLIQTTIHPDTWESLGGPSSIIPIGDMIAISTIEMTHRKILQLLRSLQAARSIDPERALETPSIRIESMDDPASTIAAEKLDACELRIASNAPTIPLDRWASQVAEQTGSPVWLNRQDLEEYGIRQNKPVDVILKPLPARLLLTESLRPLSMTFSIVDRTIVLETMEAAERRQNCVVYPVPDLIAPPRFVADSYTPVDQFTESAAMPGGSAFRLIDGIEGQVTTVSPDKLYNLITTMVEPESWESLGGPGTLAHFELASCMVVLSTERVHQKIRQLLIDVRRGRSIPKWPDRVFEDLYVTVAFELKSNAHSLVDAPDLIRRTTDPSSWERPQASLTQTGNLLVVRSQIKTIVRIEKLLGRLEMLKYRLSLPAQHGGLF